MNLRAVDLNLLVVLDALLDEAHVSRAAARLGLSQPATSSALDRCRHLFDDRLLERADGGMRLTAKAEALREPLRLALAQVGAVVGIAPPPLAETQAVLHIVMADALGAIVAPKLHDRVARAAPGVRLVLHPWSGGKAALAAAAKGAIDLIVSVLPRIDSRHFHVEDVLDERYLVAMRADHPAAGAITLETWLAWPHVVTSASGQMSTHVDDILRASGLERRVGSVVPNFLVIPDMLATTDMIALVPSICREVCERAGLVVSEPPIAIPSFQLQLAYHRRQEEDVAVRFVAGCVRELVQTAGGRSA